MKWTGVDIEQTLLSLGTKSLKVEEERTLNSFKALLEKEDFLDEQVLVNITEAEGGEARLKWRKLDSEKVVHASQIKKLCTLYRLRFLDTKYFKGEIPHEAVSKIKQLQRKGRQEIKSFKILAPAPMFNLEKKDSDPLLFIPLGKDLYYLVHKWGNDLNPLRKFLVLPFRNFKSLISTVALFALLVVMAIPDSVYIGPYDQSSGALRVIFFFYLFIAFSGLTALYGFSRLKNFNSALWNSKYID